MKKTRDNLKTGTLAVLAICATAYGQDKSPLPPADKAAMPATNSVTSAPATTAKAAKPWRFEGNDLHMGKVPPITFHGFASQGFVVSDKYNYFGNTSDGTFQFNEFGLNASCAPFERTRISVQGFTYDLGEVGNHEFMLDYAQAEYTASSYLGFRGGRVRRPQGIYNHVLDVDLARTSIFLPQGVYDARWRDYTTSVDGGSFFGDISLGKVGSLSYELYAGALRLSDQGGIYEQTLGSVKSLGVNKFDRFEGGLMYGGQLWWTTPIQGLRSGLSLAMSDGIETDATIPATPPFMPRSSALHAATDNSIVLGSLDYQKGNLTLQTEYISVINVGHDYLNGALFKNRRSRGDGWYAGTAYRFCKFFESGLYHSQIYMDANDRNFDSATYARSPKSRAYQYDTALSLRFDITSWWIFKLEGHYLTGTASLYNAYGQNPPATQNRDGWWMFAAKTTFSF